MYCKVQTTSIATYCWLFLFPCVQSSKSSSVSMWRTYFVANEWNELQTCRKTNLSLNIISSIFFLSFVGFGNWATTDPYKSLRYHDDADLYNAPMSCELRFALIASVYLLTGETIPAFDSFLLLFAHEEYTLNWPQSYYSNHCLSNTLHSSIQQNIKSLACLMFGLRSPMSGQSVKKFKWP